MTDFHGVASLPFSPHPVAVPTGHFAAPPGEESPFVPVPVPERWRRRDGDGPMGYGGLFAGQGGDFPLAHDQGDADVGFHDGHAVFPRAGQHGPVLCPGSRSEGGNEQVPGAVQHRYAGDVRVPPVVADDHARPAEGGIESAAVPPQAVEPP